MPLSPFQVNDDLHLRRVWEQTGLGYGYQTWVFDDPRAMFGLLGAFGQAIYVDPGSRLVMVHTAVRTRPSDPTWKRWRCGAAWWPRWVRADNNPPELKGSGVSRSRAMTAKNPSPASTGHFSAVSPRCIHTFCRHLDEAGCQEAACRQRQ